MNMRKMMFNRISLTWILFISYVTSFQKAEKNQNQLSTEKNKLDLESKDYLKVQFSNTSNNIYGNILDRNSAENAIDLLDKEEEEKISNSESSESIEDGVLTDLFSKEEIQDFRGLVSSIHELSVYDGVYYPYENANSGPHRRRKRAADALVQNLNDVVKQLEKMVESNNDKEKKTYFDQAVSSLDNYIKGVKDSAKVAKNSTIQIMKLDNVLIVQCAGWLWYPVSKLNKTITCADGIMRFENRDRTLARACNLYNCMDLAL